MTPHTCRHVSPGDSCHGEEGNLLLDGQIRVEAPGLFSVAVTSHTCPEHNSDTHAAAAAAALSYFLLLLLLLLLFLITARAVKIWPRQMGEQFDPL